MVFVKTVTRKTMDGTVRKYYYLAENYRAGGRIKIRIIRRLSEDEAREFSQSQAGFSKDRVNKQELEAIWEAIVNLKAVCEQLIAKKTDCKEEDWETERTLLRVVGNLYNGTASNAVNTSTT